jgi:hypothetical protein
MRRIHFPNESSPTEHHQLALAGRIIDPIADSRLDKSFGLSPMLANVVRIAGRGPPRSAPQQGATSDQLMR